MITEEKLQQFLDDLRIGKYDSLSYELKVNSDILKLSLKDLNKNVECMAILHYGKEYIDRKRFEYLESQKMGLEMWTKEWCKINEKIDKLDTYPVKKITIRPNVEGHYGETIRISDMLWNSFVTFIREQSEKDNLVYRANIESAFGL